ncbi:CRTAC1 family protein [Candidatus Nitrotoga sp. 1052]|uniref:CRTAC1 family protein n=1 Tax=Candidatus Nitrotoga sp. 1052 TaxID=2886964 RepID=UPI001EF5A15F|nr:CRTAC1 family protein [Candidatus Nitrotoga sp. 1052]CAH1087237.1 UnbV_ASPIC domain-containing protein [Candidatus Nitrotoga sp. 1052]
MPKTLRYFILIVIIIALAFGVTFLRHAEVNTIIFEDSTSNSGITYIGMTHGAAWGDFDGDGLPDLYVTNHLRGAKLFRNLGQGRFSDVTDTLFAPKDLSGDKHGAAWADFDNDGRMDLVQLTGAGQGVGSEPKRLFQNLGTKFEDVAEVSGIANPFGRTRMPLWHDFNRDGQLDLFQGAESRFDKLEPPFIFLQQGGKFSASTDALKFVSRSPMFCITTSLNNDNHPNVVCKVTGGKTTSQIFDTSTLPTRELDLLPKTAFEDIAAGDFDNDGFIDLYLARKNPPGPVAFGRPGSNEVIADVRSDQANVDKPIGFTFRSTGQLTFRVASASPNNALSVDRIHLGKQGTHPGNFTFALSSKIPGVAGLPANEPGKQAGVFIGMTAPDQWEVRVTAPREVLDKSKHQQIAIKVTSTGAITDLAAIGDPPSPEEAPARLFMNRDAKLVEESDKRGINKRIIAGVNVVAGDFDNDMHLDLFVVASGEIGKQENLLLLNRGDGHFDVVRAAGGAAGDRKGVGDSVTTVDYNGDGFLDLLVATGGSMGRSLGLPSENGTYRLYHNVGNGNHWLELDLEGTSSNRDGIGAIIRVTAGGVTQVRVQDGGIHERGQNHQRLHFGLAKHQQVEKIRVVWPSGVVQELQGVKADQVLRIKEPGQPAIGGAA